jgi:hypothetical protein
MLGFGSSIWEWADHLQICKKDVMTEARSFARSLQANLGGTEIGPALGRARQILGRSRDGHILLITDGEVSNWQSIVSKASRSRHRIFAVGVGSAVSEAFLRELSQSTSGACELTAPGEDIALPVLRQFDRMRAARSRRVEILWPEGATQLTPAHTPLVFEGDTLIASAVMPLSRRLGTAESAAAIAGTAVTLRIETETGQIIDQTLPITVATAGESGPEQRSSVARIAAAQRLRLLDDAAGLACALRYQLVSRWTHAIVVAERAPEDKTDGLPALRVVPQMMAAGWSGMGIVAASLKVAESSGDLCWMSPAIQPDPVDLPLFISFFVKSLNDRPDKAALDPTLLSLMCAPMSASRDIDKLSDELGVRPMTMLYAPLLLHLAKGPLKTHLTYEAHAAIQSLYADYEAWHARLRDAIEHARDLDRVVRPLADSIKKVREPGRQLYETLIAIHLQLEALEADVPRVTRRFIDAIDHHRQSTQSSEQTGSMSG